MSPETFRSRALECLRLAQDAVYERTGVWLRPEIELLGRWTPPERDALLGGRAVSHG